MNVKENCFDFIELVSIVFVVTLFSPVLLFMYIVDKIDSNLEVESYHYD